MIVVLPVGAPWAMVAALSLSVSSANSSSMVEVSDVLATAAITISPEITFVGAGANCQVHAVVQCQQTTMAPPPADTSKMRSNACSSCSPIFVNHGLTSLTTFTNL